MNNSTSITESKTKRDIDIKVSLFYLFLYLICAMLIAGLCYLLSANKFYNFTINEEPTFSLPYQTTNYLTMIAINFVGLASFLMWITLRTNARPKKEIYENFITLGILMITFLLYPLFTYALHLPIVGCIVLGITIALSIYTTYRYYNSSISSGVFITIWTLWLMYLFILNFAYCLL